MHKQQTDCKHKCHLQESPAKEVCVHLYNKKATDYYRSFTGQGKEYQLICSVCKNYLNKFMLNLKSVCCECFEQIENENDFYEYLGEPGVDELLLGVQVTHSPKPLPMLNVDSIQAIVPVSVDPLTGESGSKWLLFDTANHLKFLDLDYNSVTLLAIVPFVTLNADGEIKIHVSPKSDFATVVSAGRTTAEHKGWNHGVVIRLSDGEITLTLDRGDYHTEQSDFSCVFFEAQGKTLMVHATDWNRLDISDPETGKILTTRDPQKRAEEAWLFNQNNSTEFSGRLIVSPDQRWIVDSGWVWHPVGVVSRWDLQHWLHKNVWESDNGPSKLSLVHRAYFWDGPICWINSETLCVWGLGDDDDNMVPAALVIDIRTGKLKDWFPGPGTGLFVFDEYLYTVENGALSAWDVEQGIRVHYEPDFAPIAYDPGRKKFLSLVNDECVLTSIEFSALEFNLSAMLDLSTELSDASLIMGLNDTSITTDLNASITTDLNASITTDLSDVSNDGSDPLGSDPSL